MIIILNISLRCRNIYFELLYRSLLGSPFGAPVQPFGTAAMPFGASTDPFGPSGAAPTLAPASMDVDTAAAAPNT